MHPSSFLVALLLVGCAKKTETSPQTDAGARASMPDASAASGGNAATPRAGGASSTGDASVIGILSVEPAVDAATPTNDAATAPVERCANGLDDDADGKTDCEDEDCAGYECIAVPAGWAGPSAMWRGAEADLPFCPAPFVTASVVGRVGPSAGRASCPACECTHGDAECRIAAQAFATPDCSGDATTDEELPPSQCERLPTASSVRLTARAAGACAPRSQGAVRLPTVTWDEAVIVCDTSSFGKGCSGAACAERPRVPFDPNLCVHRAGEHACPQGFTRRTVAYAAFDDSRACSECSCGPPSCEGSASVYVNELCGVGERGVATDATCEAIVDPSPTNGLSLVYDASAPTCAAVPSVPRGDVEGTGATTICCR